MSLIKTFFSMYLNLCTIILTWYWSCLCNIWQTFLCYILFCMFYKQFMCHVIYIVMEFDNDIIFDIMECWNVGMLDLFVLEFSISLLEIYDLVTKFTAKKIHKNFMQNLLRIYILYDFFLLILIRIKFHKTFLYLLPLFLQIQINKYIFNRFWNLAGNYYKNYKFPTKIYLIHFRQNLIKNY